MIPRERLKEERENERERGWRDTAGKVEEGKRESRYSGLEHAACSFTHPEVLSVT